MKTRSEKNLVLISAFFVFLSSCSIFKPNKKDESGSSKQRYEQKLGFKLSPDFNEQFISEIVKYINSPYKYGGETASGFDCSGLVYIVYRNVFNMTLPRKSADMFKKSKKKKENDLTQGDLCFFKINAKEVNHVGMFIQEGYFIHASTKSGVIISSFSEPYYKKTFVSYGSFF